MPSQYLNLINNLVFILHTCIMDTYRYSYVCMQYAHTYPYTSLIRLLIRFK